MIEHTTVTDPQDVRRPASRFYWQTVLLIFVLAAGLRGSLAVFNREANDDHYEVVKLILEGRTGLTLADCHECFHPKFFYYVCAAMIRIFGLSTEVSRVVAGQLLNSLAGLLTLGLVFSVLNAAPLHAKWRLWAFTLIALNPRLIAINGQFSNDSFAILFATAAIFLTLRLLQSPSVWLGVITQLMLSCALMTKGTTWVVAIAMAIIFFVRALLDQSKNRRRLFAGLYVITALNGFMSIQLAGYDFDNYDAYANMGRGQPLHLWQKTSVGRPGVQSVVDGYLTFRLLELLSDPQSTNGYAIEQQHRTSVWTHLYARANFAQFEQHPSSWLTTNPSVLLIAKCSMVLGLLPLFFLLVGLGSSARRSLFAWRTWGVPSQGDYASLFCALVCCGYIAFIIKFTADYRDFAAMKVIYMLPGALPFTLVLAEGMQKAVDGLNRVVHTEPVVHIVLFCLVGLHCCGVLALVSHLADRL